MDIFLSPDVLYVGFPAYAAVGTLYARITYQRMVRSYYAAAIRQWKEKNAEQDMTPAGMQQIDQAFNSVGRKKLTSNAFDKGALWPIALVASLAFSDPKAQPAEVDARKEVENARLKKKIEHMEASMEREAKERLAALESGTEDGREGWDIV